MALPFTVAELDHVVLRCADQARMLDFYTRVLGLPEERRVEAIGLIQLRAGASMVDLVPSDQPRSTTGANVDHFCLGITVDRLEDVIAYLHSASIQVSAPAERYGARGMGRSIYVHDPEGNVIELKQMPAVNSTK